MCKAATSNALRLPLGEGSIVISFVIKYSESKADIDSLPTEQVRWIQQVTTAVNDLVK